MSAIAKSQIQRRTAGENVWLGRVDGSAADRLAELTSQTLNYEVLDSEEAVGLAMFDEIETAARGKTGDLTILLLGGRGAQALHRRLGQLAKTSEIDHILARLHVFTQDALAPMRADNSFSFVRDFERLLGEDFFRKVKSFTSMRTETDDLEREMINYLEALSRMDRSTFSFSAWDPRPALLRTWLTSNRVPAPARLTSPESYLSRPASSIITSPSLRPAAAPSPKRTRPSAEVHRTF